MKKTAFVVTLLLASQAWGQMGSISHNQTSSYDLTTHWSDCVSASCWHQSWGNPAMLLKVYAVNDKVLGIDFGNKGYEWNGYPANTWTAHPEWGAVYSLQADSKGNIWALQHWCGSGYNLGKWNGSGFTDEGVCYQKFVIAQDGSDTRYGVDINGTLWVNQSGGSSTGWQHFPFLPGVPVNSIAVINDSQLYVSGTNGNILWYNHTNGTWTKLPGVASIGYGADVNLAIDKSADLYLIGNGSNKSVYYYSGSSWLPLTQNGFTSIAASSSMLIFGVGVTSSKNGASNNLYRFNQWTPQETRTVKTTATCTGCTHTLKVMSHWKAPYAGDGGVTKIFNPNGTEVSVSSYSRLLDPFLCLENDPSCAPASSDSLDCTIASTFFADTVTDNPIVITLGPAIDVERWDGFAGSAGPLNTGTVNIGSWAGIVNMYITQGGYGCPAGTRPTCQPQFNPSQMFTECYYEDAITNAQCEGQTQIRMQDTISGRDDPYVWTGGYMRTDYPDGTFNIQCQPSTIAPNAFLYKGANGPTPPCS